MNHNKQYKVNQPMVDFRFFTRRFSILNETVCCDFNEKYKRLHSWIDDLNIREDDR